ncbi:hypothetical protein SUGI_0190540 [Cryptomeria japonica]|nr:hypothetical protein SUGI_0190540 [Cryptomeria japonica]
MNRTPLSTKLRSQIDALKNVTMFDENCDFKGTKLHAVDSSPTAVPVPGFVGVLHYGSDAHAVGWAAAAAPHTMEGSPSSIETLLVGAAATSAPHTAAPVGNVDGLGDHPYVAITCEAPSSVVVVGVEVEVGVVGAKIPVVVAHGRSFARMARAAAHLHKGIRPLPCAKTSPVVICE